MAGKEKGVNTGHDEVVARFRDVPSPSHLCSSLPPHVPPANVTVASPHPSDEGRGTQYGWSEIVRGKMGRQARRWWC